MDRKRIVFLLVLLFAALYYIARVAIFYAGLSGSISFEEEQSPLVEDVVHCSFLAIGIVGLLSLPGVYLRRPWGFWATIAVGAYTIAFDLWAFFAVQPSAGAGIVPAAVITGYLLMARKDFLEPG